MIINNNMPELFTILLKVIANNLEVEFEVVEIYYNEIYTSTIYIKPTKDSFTFLQKIVETFPMDIITISIEKERIFVYCKFGKLSKKVDSFNLKYLGQSLKNIDTDNIKMILEVCYNIVKDSENDYLK